jgi:BON domain
MNMARYDDEFERGREPEWQRERDRGYEERGRHEFGGRREDFGAGYRGVEPSRAGWGGQGFSQGSFGSYGGQGERLWNRYGAQGYGAEAGYTGRESSGGFGAYYGRGSQMEPSRGYERYGAEDRQRGREYSSERFPGRERFRGFDRGEYGYGSEGPAGYQAGYGPSGYGQMGYGRQGEYGENEPGRSFYGGAYENAGGPGYGWNWGLQPERGYEAGSHRGRGPKGWQRSDDRIREDINERLTDHPGIDASEIEVQVHNGEVTLSGAVDDRHIKRLAEDIAEGVSGVKDIHNQLHTNRFPEQMGRGSQGHSTGQSTQSASHRNQPEMAGSKK